MGIVEMTIDSLRRNSLSNEWALILKEKGAERYLPIYIGPRQANIVEKLLLGVGRVDPAEFDLSSAGIDTIFCKVEAVIINQFANNVFYAKLLLTQSKEPHSKLWGITGKGDTPHRVTNVAAFIPPASWGVFSGDFYKDEALEVDCAPAKAVAHGIRAEAPIFADEAVLDKAGIATNA